MSTGSQVGDGPMTGVAGFRKNKGAFIVFEGIDGSGKSTMSRMIHDALVAEGRECLLTAEPSDSWLGHAVRRANQDGTDDLAEALLFMADRAEHTRTIRGWVGQGKIVVCDRYYASTLAYQTALLKDRLQDPMGWLWNINEPIIMRPDITLFFHVSPELAMERLGSRDERTKFERLEFLRQVGQNYIIVEGRDPSFVRV
ncbi:MAG TPA: dTMP kinase, partial [Methanomassiliicoccales archaeon]|nr:dTMP kinase [Methanomassiliicoccales archaeon]